MNKTLILVIIQCRKEQASVSQCPSWNCNTGLEVAPEVRVYALHADIGKVSCASQPSAARYSQNIF